ncbi:MAG: hypothetical protein K1X94_05675 [Sandaracinaceae bacterium]|nr:hypothetical protein [Sandaracinaceae bacterium]
MLVLSCATACGASPPPDPNTRYGAIQREEAALERALAAEASLGDEIAREGPRDARCDLAAQERNEAVQAADRVCALARGALGSDGTVRCERARARAHEASVHVSACDGR